MFLPGESQRRGSLVGWHLWGSHRVGHDWSDLAAAAAAGDWVILFHPSLPYPQGKQTTPSLWVPGPLGEEQNVLLTLKIGDQGTAFPWVALTQAVFTRCAVLDDLVSLSTVPSERQTASNTAAFQLVGKVFWGAPKSSGLNIQPKGRFSKISWFQSVLAGLVHSDSSFIQTQGFPFKEEVQRGCRERGWVGGLWREGLTPPPAGVLLVSSGPSPRSRR